MRLAWVTGAHGFLGRHVARHLAATGWRVAGIGYGDWKDEEARAWGLELWREAAIDPSTLRDFAAEAGRPALVFHAAGSGSVGFSLQQPYEDFRANVATLAALLETVRTLTRDAVVVYPSSAAVYGMVPQGPIPESAPLAPASPYGAHKVIAESMCSAWNRQFGVRCASIRFFSLFGPELRKQLIWDLARKLTGTPEEIRLFGTGEETRDFLHVGDAARLVSLVAEEVQHSPIVINGGSGRAVSVRELATMVAALFGARTAVRFTGEARTGDPAHQQADVTHSSRLGFTPAWSLMDGLRDYVDWFRVTRLTGSSRR